MRLLAASSSASGSRPAAARAVTGGGAPRPALPPLAASAASAASAAAPPLPPPLPLTPRVTDGAWGSTDARLMREALDDAERVVKIATAMDLEADTAAAAAAAAPSAPRAASSPPAGSNEKPSSAPAIKSRRAQAAALFSRVLLGRSPDDLRALAVSHGQPAYRGDQLHGAIASGRAGADLSGVRVLPRAWRERLEREGWSVGRPVVSHEAVAPDGTRKLLLRLADGHEIETVGIPVDGDEGDDGMSGGGGGGGGEGAGEDARGAGKGRGSGAAGPSGQASRLTCCVSTMAGGCPLRCAFCATGRSAFARNLAPHEILAQAMAVRDAFSGRRVSRVVFMGGGEPLVNLPSVLEAVALLRRDLGMSGRAITISTVGVPNTIARLAEARLACTLAVSLHAPEQALRERLVPSAKAYPLDALMRDCADYFRATGRRVTFEYTLMAGQNDSDEHARALAALLKRHGMLSSSPLPANAPPPFGSASFSPPPPSSSSSSSSAAAASSSSSSSSDARAAPSWGGGAHVNLIPYNSVDGAGFSRPARARVAAFRKELQESAGRALSVSVRATRGEEASAACGQLAYKANGPSAGAAAVGGGRT
jgi:23S rRNA (adenine2503-C2)-methyltransferase